MTGEEHRHLYWLSAKTYEQPEAIAEFDAYLRSKCEKELQAHGFWDLHLQSVVCWVPAGLELHFVSRSVMFEDIVEREYDSLPPKEFQAPKT